MKTLTQHIQDEQDRTEFYNAALDDEFESIENERNYIDRYVFQYDTRCWEAQWIKPVGV
jgi:hypothetical protein